MEEIAKDILLLTEKKYFNKDVSITSRNFIAYDDYWSSIFLTSNHLINAPKLCM